MPRLLIPFAFLFLLGDGFVQAEDWPEFRGPTGQGHYEGKTCRSNGARRRTCVWKQPFPARAGRRRSSWMAEVYLTTAVPVRRQGPVPSGPLSRRGQGEDPLATGGISPRWRQDARAFIRKNSHASPTPITDGKRLYVHFGHQGTACLDLDGKIVWRNTSLQLRPGPRQRRHADPGRRPAGLLRDGGDKQFVVALDKADGKVLWKTDRKREPAQEILLQHAPVDHGQWPAADHQPGRRRGHGLRSRRRQGDLAGQYTTATRSSPARSSATAWSSSARATTRPADWRSGRRDRATSPNSHIAWTQAKESPHTPSPLLLVGDELYMVSDEGYRQLP